MWTKKKKELIERQKITLEKNEIKVVKRGNKKVLGDGRDTDKAQE